MLFALFNVLYLICLLDRNYVFGSFILFCLFDPRNECWFFFALLLHLQAQWNKKTTKQNNKQNKQKHKTTNNDKVDIYIYIYICHLYVTDAA